MNEKELMESIFENGKWKGKYTVLWCDLCEMVEITCPVCKLPSCSGGGCPECSKDYDEWSKTKHWLEHYISLDEMEIYSKCQRLKKLMVESLRQSESEINWKKLVEKGELSSYDEFVFKNFISEQN
jgi:hypothetical protein